MPALREKLRKYEGTRKTWVLRVVGFYPDLPLKNGANFGVPIAPIQSMNFPEPQQCHSTFGVGRARLCNLLAKLEPPFFISQFGRGATIACSK